KVEPKLEMRKRGGGGGGWATERKRYLLYKDGWCTVGDAGDGDREEANAEKRLLRVWQNEAVFKACSQSSLASLRDHSITFSIFSSNPICNPQTSYSIFTFTDCFHILCLNSISYQSRYAVPAILLLHALHCYFNFLLWTVLT
ncbi:hypothetical protein VIGAN_04001100, partial [Vigna angularis var. angularis]